ncbi:hypothetical protein QVD17_20062 [Tagetes erecta]|uniref:Uncharacterized protein n=1 Tax=Tagetes erecta TaxID=13708 RepID=A0AAD8KKK9_TARER|nr:hypothetical protein QVD17_20062 [Tagetes erecta]
MLDGPMNTTPFQPIGHRSFTRHRVIYPFGLKLGVCLTFKCQKSPTLIKGLLVSYCLDLFHQDLSAIDQRG